MEKIYIPWDGWEAVRELGKGSYGTVYEIRRVNYGFEERSAMKVLKVPQNMGDIDLLRAEGMDEESISNTYHGYVSDMVGEYRRMLEFKHSPNIVHVEDYKVIRDDNSLIWRVFIKMELLTPLLKASQLIESEEQIIRFAIDLCRAVAACHSKNVIHRDIKPQNIFCDSEGNFKLGDFGVSKIIENTTHATVGVGALNYMAPEVLRGDSYGAQADIYSVGMTLYWALNCHCTPFVPIDPQYRTAGMIEEARRRRFCGESIPKPVNGSEGLKQIVLKALAYDPKERFLTMRNMLEALESLSDKAADEDEEKPDQREEIRKRGGPAKETPVSHVDSHAKAFFKIIASVFIILSLVVFVKVIQWGTLAVVPVSEDKNASTTESNNGSDFDSIILNNSQIKNTITSTWDSGSIEISVLDEKSAYIEFHEVLLSDPRNLDEDKLALLIFENLSSENGVIVLFSLDESNKLVAEAICLSEDGYLEKFDWEYKNGMVVMNIVVGDDCEENFSNIAGLNVALIHPDSTNDFVHLELLDNYRLFAYESETAPFVEVVSKDTAFDYVEHSWNTGEAKFAILDETHMQIELSDELLETYSTQSKYDGISIILFKDMELKDYFEMIFDLESNSRTICASYKEGGEGIAANKPAKLNWKLSGKTIRIDLQLEEDAGANFSDIKEFAVIYNTDVTKPNVILFSND